MRAERRLSAELRRPRGIHRLAHRRAELRARLPQIALPDDDGLRVNARARQHVAETRARFLGGQAVLLAAKRQHHPPPLDERAAPRRVRVRLQQRVEPVVQRDHALLGVDGVQPIAPVPDRVDAPRALPRLLLGQVAAHQRVNVLLEAGKMPLAADEVGHLQNDLLDICVVKEKHGRAQPVGQRDHRLRQLAEIRRFHHQARNALIHQRLKGVRHELRVAARVSQRGYDQIAAVKIRKLHAGGVVFKQNGRRHGALQSVPTGDQAQMLNILKPKQLFNVNQARSPPALFCG